MFLRIFNAAKRIRFLYRLSSVYQRELKALQILHGFTDSVILSRQRDLTNSCENETIINDSENDVGAKKKTAFLDLLMQSTIDGQPLSNEDIREEVDTFMFEVCFIISSGMTRS